MFTFILPSHWLHPVSDLPEEEAGRGIGFFKERSHGPKDNEGVCVGVLKCLLPVILHYEITKLESPNLIS